MGRTQTMPKSDAPLAQGTPLPSSLRHSLEAVHHCDLSAVRVHEGHEAVHLGVNAFARGTDIFFAPGQMPPPVAHEAWHVVQQSSPVQRSLAIGNGEGANNAPPLARGLVNVEPASGNGGDASADVYKYAQPSGTGYVGGYDN